MVGAMNSLYYLYSGTNYWTMSPSRFYNGFGAVEILVRDSGAFGNWDTNSWLGVRPVINIDPTNLTVHGTGTKEDPYTVS